MAGPPRSVVALRVARVALALLFSVLATLALFESVHSLAGHDYVAELLLCTAGLGLAASATTLVRPEIAE